MAACFFWLASRALSLWFPRAIFPKFQQSAWRILEAAWQQILSKDVEGRSVGRRAGTGGAVGKFGIEVWEWSHPGRLIGF